MHPWLLIGEQSGIDEENLKYATKDVVGKLKQIIDRIREFMFDISNTQTYKNIYFALRAIMKETFFRNLQDSSFEEKIARMTYTSKVGNAIDSCMKSFNETILMLVKSARESARKIENYTSLQVDEVFNDIDNSEFMAFSRHIYMMLKSENLPDSFISSYMMQMAFIAPFYFIIYKCKLSSELKTDNPEVVSNPLNPHDRDPSTISTYEKKFVKLTKEIIESYKDAETDIEKMYVLGSFTIQRMFKILASSFLLLNAFPISLLGAGWLYSILMFGQMALTTCYIFILGSSLVYLSLATEYGEKESEAFDLSSVER